MPEGNLLSMGSMGSMDSMDSMDEPILLAFRAFAPRERVRRYLAGLLGLRSVPLLIGALGPGITLYALDANPPYPLHALAIGVGVALFAMSVGLLDALLRPTPPFTLEVDESGVRETRGGVTIDRGREWVLGIAREGDSLLLRVRGDKMRSFQLAPTSVTVLHVDGRATSAETIERLERIFGSVAKRT